MSRGGFYLFFSLFSGFDSLAEHYYLLTLSRVWISVATWDTLYDYDSRGSFAWVVIGDATAVHLPLRILSPIYAIFHLCVNVLLLPHAHLIIPTIFIAVIRLCSGENAIQLFGQFRWFVHGGISSLVGSIAHDNARWIVII